jgi:pyridoxamine 5'-phosphate oxidase
VVEWHSPIVGAASRGRNRVGTTRAGRYRAGVVDLPPLDERTVAPDPLDQFRRWYEAASAATGDRAAAMTLATVGGDGRPSARVVLLRGFDERGFVFFTNYQSRKGRDLAVHPVAAAVLHWSELEAQVRIEGGVTRVGDAESDAYFAGRPRGHRIGAWASDQSRPVSDRAALEARVREVEARFPADVPRPPYWGGYRIRPDVVEFWRGRADRVHDRVCYERNHGGWSVTRLNP